MAEHNEVMKKFGNGEKTLKSYLFGLGLSLLFTLIAFTLVGEHSLSNTSIYICLSVLAICQLIAQIVCFLRMNMSPEGQWNTLPFIFAIVIVGVLVGGSLWIMYNMNYFMVN